MVAIAPAKPFYAARDLPWNKIGTDIEGAATWADAIQQAGLDYDLELGIVKAGPSEIIMPMKRAVYRVDSNRPLAVVGTGYRPVQRRDMAEFMDALIEERTMRFLRAGELLNGLRAYFLATLDEDIRVGDDRYVPYLLGVDSCDGGHALKLFPTFVNVASNNTLSLALSRGGTRFSIRHTGSIQAKFDAAKKVLNITTNELRRAQQWLADLLATPTGDEELGDVQRILFGDPDDASTRKQKAIDAFRSIYNEETKRHGENGYSILTTTVGYADHSVYVRSGSAENQMLSSYFGNIAEAKRKGMNAVAKVLGQPL